MIVTTSQNVEGKQITKYLGIVAASEYFALLPSTKAADKAWAEHVREATWSLSKQASELDADAVIAARYDAINNSMNFVLYATGTAVKFA